MICKLSAWAVRNRCTRIAVNELLSILRNCGLELPKDSRTLVNTPRVVITSKLCVGNYCYYGLPKGILNRLHALHTVHSNKMELFVNVDGLPLFKSSSIQLWPILCSFDSCNPFLVAIFCGDSVDDFMSDFLIEYCELKASGLKDGSQLYFVRIKVFICDVPARQFLKCIKGHNAYNACERSIVRGTYIARRVVLNDAHRDYRNKDVFSAVGYDSHQHKKSPLDDCSIDCIKEFALDYMHLICLGVVKRLMTFLKQGPRVCRLSASQIDKISNKLQELNGKLPSEFVRQPQSLKEISRWKATEYRQFLLYTDWSCDIKGDSQKWYLCTLFIPFN